MREPAGEHRLEQAEAYLQHRLRGRLWGVRVLVREGGIILQGQALNYYAKQLGQHIAKDQLQLTVVVNEIEVRPALPSHTATADAAEQ
jgi:hypothetical protein